MKIKLSILEKICECATAKEIDFLLYTLQFQNNHGVVRGLQWDEICKAIEIHKSTYYSIINSLESKGLISVNWKNEDFGFWEFKLNNNLFWSDDDFKEGYININTRFLHIPEFLNLKQAEKVICLKILSQYRVNRTFMSFKIKTLCMWTNKSDKSVKKYASALKKIFGDDLTINENMITLKTSQAHFSRYLDEADCYNEHELDFIMKKNKAEEADSENKKSVITMFKLFKKYGRDIINTAITRCIENHRKIIASYINTMIHVIYNENQTITIS